MHVLEPTREPGFGGREIPGAGVPLGTRTDWFARQIRDSTPAPGLRTYAYGSLCNVGQLGYSYSSSVPAGGSNAYYLYFSNSGINPQYGGYRSFGLPVRCLLE